MTNNDIKVVYAVIITKDEHDNPPYLVYIPKLDGYTQGTDLENCLEMARDYIGLTLQDYVAENRPIPTSDTELPPAKPGETVSFVAVNVSAYQRKHETKLVKKTLSIPYYLNEAAKAENLNFSKILTKALKKRLNY